MVMVAMAMVMTIAIVSATNSTLSTTAVPACINALVNIAWRRIVAPFIYIVLHTNVHWNEQNLRLESENDPGALQLQN